MEGRKGEKDKPRIEENWSSRGMKKNYSRGHINGEMSFP